MARFHIDEHYNHSSSKWWIFPVVLVILAVASVASVLVWYQAQLEPLSNSNEEIIVTVDIGATAPEIGKLLEQNSVIRSATAFEWYVRLNNQRNDMQAGGYKFMQSESVEEIVHKLVEGEVSTDLLTILPAQRLDQIKLAFVASGYTQSEVDKAFLPAQYSSHPARLFAPADSNLEGYLYPESFQKSSNTKPEDIIKASLSQLNSALTPEVLKAYQSKGLSAHEAIIIASIVEREVNNPEDRATVAQVFLTRYERGIKLGSDPTALYGALLAGIEPSVSADTPYNTRIYGGLPPGPINNVSAQSLQAVAFPSDTDYLFFVSGDDGKTYFSHTLAEHESLTAQHCVELCKSY